MDQAQWNQEQAHLAETLEIVAQERIKVERALGMENGGDRYLMVSDDGSSDAVVAQQVMRAKLRELNQLRLSGKAPYFARVDFTPDAPQDRPSIPGGPLYIGRWGVMKTPECRMCVVDWRSPTANLYYSGQVGRVDYAAPDGVMTGEITLKRMFSIADGRLEGMQDTGVVGQERFLTEALSQPATARLREVVTTIQAEQNTVIRYEPTRPLCVQGAAGSGKTTIALHRVAWVLYRLQKTLEPRQMLILAPNPLFLSYIGGVLPDLGVDEVRQMTFEQLCGQLMGKRMPRIQAREGLGERLRMTKAQRDARDGVLRRKGSVELYGEIERFLRQWEQTCMPTQDICLGKRVLISAEEIRRYFLTDFRHFPLQARAEELRKVVGARLKKALDEAGERLEAMARDKLDALMRALPDGPERRERARRLLDARDERLRELKELPKRFWQAYDEKWATMELMKVYEAFWQDMARRDEANRAVWAATQPVTQRGRAAQEDLPALLLLAKGLYGLARMEIRHIVIDEAQDASPLQVKALRQIFGHDAFTLVGDLCQGVYGDEGLRSWEELSSGVFAHAPEIAHLGVSYRSTVEIMETALAVMRRHPVRGAGEARPVLRHGEKPTLTRVEGEKGRLEAIAAQVGEWMGEGYRSIAVTVKTERAAKRLHAALWKALPEARLVTSGDGQFDGGVQVMDASVVKGLEFDCMLIADAEAGTYPDERFYAKLFYVLCTRPLHRLAFLSAGEPPAHLNGAKILFKNA